MAIIIMIVIIMYWILSKSWTGSSYLSKVMSVFRMLSDITQGPFGPPISPSLKKSSLYNLVQEGKTLGLNLRFKTLVTQWKF